MGRINKITAIHDYICRSINIGAHAGLTSPVANDSASPVAFFLVPESALGVPSQPYNFSRSQAESHRITLKANLANSGINDPR